MDKPILNSYKLKLWNQYTSTKTNSIEKAVIKEHLKTQFEGFIVTYIKEESNGNFRSARAHRHYTNQRRHVTISNRGNGSEMWHWDLGDDMDWMLTHQQN